MMIRIFIFFSGLSLLSLMQCQDSRYCPSQYGCKCYGITMVCTRSRLTTVPRFTNSYTQILDIRYNQIQSINPGVFSYLNKLKTLYLSSNNLSTIESYNFDGLYQLQDLYLNSNNIEKIDSRAFSVLQELKNLYLQQNKIKEIQAGTFRNNYLLQNLFLSSNLISRFPQSLVETQKDLRALRLESNRLICDCGLFWLWDIANPSNLSQNIYNFHTTGICAYPNSLNRKTITSLSKTDFNCEKPIITDGPKSVDIKYETSKDVTFNCKVSANPRPHTVQWFRNNIKLFNHGKYSITDGGSVLSIKNADKNDVGIYECVVITIYGDARASAQIKIEYSVEDANDELEFDTNNEEVYDVSEFELTEDEPIETENSEDEHLKFLMMPSDLTVIEGVNTKLNCRSVDPSGKIEWLKNGEPLNDPSRFISRRNGDLEIRNVRVDDEGFYVCSIFDQNTKKYAQAKLTINVPAVFIKKPQDQEVAEGNSVEFYCSVDGKPQPTIIWKKDGMKIAKSLANNSNDPIDHYEFYQNYQLLKINNLNHEKDSGIYSCTAKNSANSITSSARLIVTQSIAPVFKIIQQDISVFEDHPIRLECFAEGDPKPQVLWYKDGKRIATDSRVYFDPYGYLTITQVKVADSGEYLCRAENKAGFAVHSFQFTVKDIYGTTISNSVIKDAIEEAKNDVSRQFQKTLNNLNDKRRPKTSADLLALLRFPKDRTLNLVLSEEIYERALDIIFRYASNITFNLTNKEFATQEILTHRQLRQISDLSGCHRYKRKVQCSQRCLKYRTFDGTCNNLDNPRWGAANTALRRLLPAVYENGFSTPRGWNKSQLYNGFMLPNARDVTTQIITTEKVTNDRKFSLMLMQWGQFLDHDITHTVMAMSLNRFSNGIACRDSCTNEQPCFPIEIMPNDTLRTHWPGKCMEFVRSSAVCGSGETSLVLNQIHQREQINQLTAYIDASMVYGSNDQDAFDIRERTINTGKLKVHITPKYPKGILPFNLDTNMDCQRDNTTTVGCFLAGDYRANEQLALLAMHNLWIRQHNTLVDKLKKLNPNWTPEQLFQEARKIVVAQIQIITFEHWLPHILGPIGMKKMGTYKKYDPTVDPTISNEFATAAFRFGHALIQPFTYRLNETFQPIPEGNLLLRDSFFAPQRYYYEGGMEPLIRGLYGVPAKLKLPREVMNSELTEKLFHITRSISQDLAALNIQRGRDHGLPGYADYRRFCSMSDINSFEDLKKEISSRQVRAILKRLYGSVRNIDLWPAGILEDVVEGSKLGPLFMCIIIDQMKALRDGDRFWYENPGVFTPAQLTELKKTSLTRIICDNGEDIDHIQKNVFLNARYPNEMSRCSEIEDMSYEPWKDCCKDNAVGLCEEPAYFYVPIEQAKRKRSADDSSENIGV